MGVNKKRHTNNDGRNQIKRGKTAISLRHIANRLRIPFISTSTPEHEED